MSTGRKKSISRTKEQKMKKAMPNSWKISEVKTPMIKQNRRLSQRKKCKYQKNAWRT